MVLLNRDTLENFGGAFSIMLSKVLLLGLLVHVSTSFLTLKTQAITRCVSESCESGVGLYPHCDDCNKFIYCVFGHPIQKECPLGLRFDIVRGVCNFPVNSTCWNANTGNRIVSQNTLISNRAGNVGSRDYFPNGRPEQLKTGNRVDQSPSKTVSTDNRDGQIPNLPDVDVSQPPVSLMTDDPPVGYDEDGHETQAPSNAFPKDSQPVGVDTNRLLPDINVSQPPVSMKTDDPPLGYDENGYETKALQGISASDSQKDLPAKENKLLPDINVSQPPVSLMTEDPPAGYDENGYETKTLAELQNKQQPVSGIEKKPVEKQQEQLPLEDVSKPPLVPEDEEQNRDFTINPDFDQGDQNSLLQSQSEDWKNMFAKMNMPGFGGIDLQNAPSGQSVQTSNGQKSEDEKKSLSTEKDPAVSANEQSSSVSGNGKSSAASANAESSVVSTNEQNAEPKAQVPCVTKCQGLPSGNYQSCNGCDSYMVCMMGLQFLTPCPDSTRWDDINKRCSEISSTCY